MALTKVNSLLVDGAINTDASGNVGIGITTIAPSGSRKVLQVTNGAAGGMLILGNGSTENPNPRIFLEGTNDLGFASGVTTGVIKFYTNDSERGRFDTNGNLLVGTTSGFGVAQGLQASASGNASLALRRLSDAGHVARFLNYNTTQVGSIGVDGASTSYNTSSDYRLKEDIAPMTDALAKVSTLKPVTYKWKIDGSAGEGFIAHELAEVVPQAVSGEKDAVDAEGNPVYQGIDTSFLVATLTAAIQELNAKVVALEAKLAAK